MNKSEKEAREFCATIKTASGSYPVNLEFTRSQMWGWCPNLTWPNGGPTIHRAGGYGYDKESAVLADVLRYLADTKTDEHKIGACSGAGVPALISALRSIGWVLEFVANGRSFRGYSIYRFADPDGPRRAGNHIEAMANEMMIRGNLESWQFDQLREIAEAAKQISDSFR